MLKSTTGQEVPSYKSTMSFNATKGSLSTSGAAPVTTVGFNTLLTTSKRDTSTNEAAIAWLGIFITKISTAQTEGKTIVTAKVSLNSPNYTGEITTLAQAHEVLAGLEKIAVEARAQQSSVPVT